MLLKVFQTKHYNPLVANQQWGRVHSWWGRRERWLGDITKEKRELWSDKCFNIRKAFQRWRDQRTDTEVV